MQQTKHEALYDCFSIIRNLEKAMNGISEGEVNLYSYLACLLGLFVGNPSSLWGYGFANTEYGAPYSKELMEALKTLELRGDIIKRHKIYYTTQQGLDIWKAFDMLSQFSEREPFLKAATDSVLALPTSTVRYALYNEPSMKSASLKHKASNLLGSVVTDLLHDQFGALKQVLGDARDLFIPATVWMSYLAEEKSRAIEGSDD